MYFKIWKKGLERIQEDAFWKEAGVAAFITYEELKESEKWKKLCRFSSGKENVRACRVEFYADGIYAVMCIPAKKLKQEKESLSFYITEEKIIFLMQEKGILEEIAGNLAQQNKEQEYSREQLLYDILCGFIAKDLTYIEKMEKALSVLEEQVFKGNIQDFNIHLLEIKKHIFRFYRYYSQLVELGNELEGNAAGVLQEENLYLFGRYQDKVSRLAAETQVLREYAVQVQEVYQSEIAIRQNNIMKMLTVVTTIFLPLSLIAGWYGMNFHNMPELSWHYGYALVAVFSVIVLLLCLWLFKRKGFW